MSAKERSMQRDNSIQVNAAPSDNMDGISPYQLYLDDIRLHDTATLSRKDEQNLFHQVQIGYQARRQLEDNGKQQNPDINLDKIHQLIEEGNEATQKLIEHNLRLSIYFARQFFLKQWHPIVELNELIQEGNLGLLKAIETYEEQKGKFSTWAAFHIKQKIMEALKQAHKNPHSITEINMDDRRPIQIAINALKRDYISDTPSAQQIWDWLKKNSNGVNPRWDIPEINDYLKCQRALHPLELDAPRDDEADDKDTFIDRMIPDTSDSPEQIMENKQYLQEQKDRVQSLIEQAGLTPLQRQVLELYYHIGEDPTTVDVSENRTLEGIAIILGKTKENYQQILKAAKGKIRKLAKHPIE